MLGHLPGKYSERHLCRELDASRNRIGEGTSPIRFEGKEQPFLPDQASFSPAFSRNLSIDDVSPAVLIQSFRTERFVSDRIRSFSHSVTARSTASGKLASSAAHFRIVIEHPKDGILVLPVGIYRFVHGQAPFQAACRRGHVQSGRSFLLPSHSAPFAKPRCALSAASQLSLLMTWRSLRPLRTRHLFVRARQLPGHERTSEL